MSWFKREDGDYPAAAGDSDAERNVRTEGLWIKCPACRAIIFKADLEANLNVCPKCQHHFKIDARKRIALLLEPGFELVDGGLRSTDPLNFADVKPYKQRLRAAREATGLDDAILNAVGRLGHHSVVLSAMEYGFIGGSMGAVVGETIARAVDRARISRNPLIIVAASGGARMMEGVVSLMQMAKISTALAQLGRCQGALHLRAHRSNHRRRHRQLRHVRRPQHSRTRRPHWLRRPPRHRANHPPETSRRLPALRISA
jgi:acetyl-CoA carboxylase carboxyl transferase subunit beta